MTLRHTLSWKALFYDALLPALRRLGPARADAALGALGRLAGRWPPRWRALAESVDRARAALGADWDRVAVRSELAAHVARYLARDYPLEGTSDAELNARFDVAGFGPVRDELARGGGAILLGCHLGAHLAAVHWLVRREVPLRLLVQRPRHVSPTLRRWFDRDDGHPLPQSAFFLRRGLDPAEAARRVLRARDALRAGMAVYLNGDIPWASPAARPGRLLGRGRTFLALWADLSALTGAAVVPVFCAHRPGGRYALAFEEPRAVPPGGEADALAAYLRRLDAEIAAHPADAVPHLTWPTYTRPAPIPPASPGHHPERTRSAPFCQNGTRHPIDTT